MSDRKISSNQELLARLERQPAIRARLEALLDITENRAGDVKLADDAEARLLQEIRGMGQELMQAWAHNEVQASEQDVRNGGRAYREGKKNFTGTRSSAISR